MLSCRLIRKMSVKGAEQKKMLMTAFSSEVQSKEKSNPLTRNAVKYQKV